MLLLFSFLPHNHEQSYTDIDDRWMKSRVLWNQVPTLFWHIKRRCWSWWVDDNIPGGSQPRSHGRCPSLLGGASLRVHNGDCSSAWAPPRLQRHWDEHRQTNYATVLVHHTHTHTLHLHHTIPGFIFGSPLHIVIVILHLDEPVSQDRCCVIYVVICRHPVGGWKQPQVKHACTWICSTPSVEPLLLMGLCAEIWRKSSSSSSSSHHQYVEMPVVLTLTLRSDS